MKQRITVLGSTGSIGTSTLDVVARHPERFEVFALSAATQVELMLEQCARFRPRYAAMASAPHARLLAEKIEKNDLQTQVLQAPEAIETIASHPDVDAVMAAIVGAAGLAPCLAAARAGKRLLLANKEALVVGGARVAVEHLVITQVANRTIRCRSQSQSSVCWVTWQDSWPWLVWLSLAVAVKMIQTMIQIRMNADQVKFLMFRLSITQFQINQRPTYFVCHVVQFLIV